MTDDNRERRLAMRRLADSAFRTDPSYSIDMAKAGWDAREKQARKATPDKAVGV